MTDTSTITNTASFLRDRLGVSDDQLAEARHRSERLGGSLEDHLYILGAVSEDQLLRAYRFSRDWRTILLTDRRIPAAALRCLPGPIAWRLKALPVAVDPSNRTAAFACLNPEDKSLCQKLSELCGYEHIDLLAAVGPVLESAIIEHYRSELAAESSHGPAEEQAIKNTDTLPRAFLVSPDWKSECPLATMLTAVGYAVILTDSPWEILDDIRDWQPPLVFIRDAVYPGRPDYLKAFRSASPGTTIHRYQQLKDLFGTPPLIQDSVRYLSADLQTAIAAAATAVGVPPALCYRFGALVDALCRRLDLESAQLLPTISAGYLLDIAELSLRNNPAPDRESAFYKIMSQTGDDAVLPPAVMKSIRQMYPDLTQASPEQPVDPEMVGGNVLTIADFYFRHFGSEERLTQYRYETVAEHVRARIGSLFLPEVAEAFLREIEKQIVYGNQKESQNHALILDEPGIARTGLIDCIETAGFEGIVTDRLDQFTSRYRQLRPDVLVIAANGGAERVQGLVDRMAATGVVFASTPSIVLHNADHQELVQSLLGLGLYDVIHFTGSYDLLRLRLQRLSTERERESRQRLHVLQDLGTHGSLAHMNVIDLLQAMGPGNKTLRISVSAQGNQLTMYLSGGQIVYAECEGNTGANAVFRALSWDRGIWSVDRLEQADLPAPNVDRSIDSILIEGCHLLDERRRSNQPAAEPGEVVLGSIFED
jgi:hypothetical protein